MLEALKRDAEARGDRLAAISVDRLMDVKRGFDEHGVDTSPYYDFGHRSDLGFEARSVLAVATPSPIASAIFTIGDKQIKAMIPASYADFDSKHDSIESHLSEFLQASGYNAVHAQKLPCKPIAVHSGLGVFGRNNTVYVEGMGSFINLYLFFSDVPCDSNLFEPLRTMDSCGNCELCVQSCPTKALTADSKFVDASRCLTMINEHDGDFPEWLPQDAHNALIGCLKCQAVCHKNAVFTDEVKELAVYDGEQSATFLNGELPEEALAPLGMKWYNRVFPRNLRALLAQHES